MRSTNDVIRMTIENEKDSTAYYMYWGLTKVEDPSFRCQEHSDGVKAFYMVIIMITRCFNMYVYMDVVV